MFKKRESAVLLVLLFVGETELLANEVDLSLITDKGWIQFTVGGEWKILKVDTKNPTRVALFQIPNPADEGTSDSTNASVVLPNSIRQKPRHVSTHCLGNTAREASPESEHGKSLLTILSRQTRTIQVEWLSATLRMYMSRSCSRGLVCRKTHPAMIQK